MNIHEKPRELSASETVGGLLYGINGLIPKVNRKYTQRKIAQARNLLLEVQKMLSQGIADGVETR
jgi:hypothetical protein